MPCSEVLLTGVIASMCVRCYLICQFLQLLVVVKGGKPVICHDA